MNGISIILPSFQEADNLKLLLPKVVHNLEEIQVPFEVLVIDTIKPMDNTEEICNISGCNYLNRRNGNMYGDAIRTGITEAQYDYIIVMDADGSHNPEDIKNMYQTITTKGADIVIGSRYVTGGYTDNPWILKIMSIMVNIAYRLIFSIKVKDVSNSFRIYKAEKLKSLRLHCDNFDIVEEILIRMQIKFPHSQFQEIPIKFGKRLYGESKRDLVKFVLSYFVTIRRLYKMKLQEKFLKS